MTASATRRTPGTPCWVSLTVHSLAATEDFYGALFGWTFAPGPQQLGPYVRALLDDREVAGMGELASGRRLPVAWTTYLASDDADATAERIRACGGTVAVGPLQAGEAGRLVIASDPLGAVFGVWQGNRHIGAQTAGEPGTPVWNGLTTQEAGVVGKFYATVFDMEAVSDGPERMTLRVEDRPVAEIHGVGSELPEHLGPHWMTYFEVADADAAARRAAELGGRIVEPPRDRAQGRSAVVADPEGAVFTVVRSGG